MDSSGDAYITGTTGSTDFPTTAGAFRTVNGDNDAFVTKLNADGTALVYSTYLGGNGYDQGNGIAVDSAGNAYITGSATSSDFPTTTDAVQSVFVGNVDAFVSELNAGGTALEYSTILGGASATTRTSVTLDRPSPWTRPATSTSRGMPARATSRSRTPFSRPRAVAPATPSSRSSRSVKSRRPLTPRRSGPPRVLRLSARWSPSPPPWRRVRNDGHADGYGDLRGGDNRARDRHAGHQRNGHVLHRDPGRGLEHHHRRLQRRRQLRHLQRDHGRGGQPGRGRPRPSPRRPTP